MSAKKCGFKCRTFIEATVLIGNDKLSAEFDRFAVVEAAEEIGNPLGADDINWFPNEEQRILAGAVVRDMLEHCPGPKDGNCGTYPNVTINGELPDFLVVIIPDGWTPPETPPA